MNVKHFAKVLGGDVVGLHNVVCPGPGHSPRDRSLSISFLADGAFLVHSHAGDSWQECRDHVSALLGLQRTKKGPEPIRVSGNRDIGEGARPIDQEAARLALAIWREAGPLAGTPGAIHLQRRGVAYEGDALRWHPSCPFGKGIRLGCMVALVRNVASNEPQAVHRTAIDAAGNKIDRKALGPIGGGAVKLTDDTDVTTVLGIGEGIESTLSIRELPDLGNMPVWACLTANGVASFPVLPGIEAVWIAADNDVSGTGQRAAQAAGQRLHAANIEVIIIAPTSVGADLNDKVAQYA